jgi:cytochrome c
MPWLFARAARTFQVRGISVIALSALLALLVAGAQAIVRAAAADPDRGHTLFEQCAACHGLADETDTDGPTLKGVIGRRAGSLEDYRYSAAMKRSEVTWTPMTLDAYITDPQGYIKGNRMAFAGIEGAADRADLIAYLEQVATPRR